MSTIGNALGIGSGIDTTALVSSLASAARAARDLRVGAIASGNDARISGMAKLRAGLDELITKQAAFADDAAATPATRADAFVKAYNTLNDTLHSLTAPGGKGVKAGALVGDAGARATMQGLARMASGSLAAFGVATARDGSLRLDTARLAAADPAAAAEALGGTLKSALTELRTRLTGDGGALGVASARYARVAASVQATRDRIDADTDALTTRLTVQFAAMDKAVAASKASQAYITQQVAAWNANS
jgi:flagellar hook-associated protein 2